MSNTRRLYYGNKVHSTAIGSGRVRRYFARPDTVIGLSLTSPRENTILPILAVLFHDDRLQYPVTDYGSVCH